MVGWWVSSFAVDLSGNGAEVGEDNLPIVRVGLRQEERQQYKEPLSHNSQKITQEFEPIHRIIQQKD